MLTADIFHPPIPKNTGEGYAWLNLHGGSVGLALSNAIRENSQPFLIIMPDSLSAARMVDELTFFAGNQPTKIAVFPDWETLPYDHFSPHQDIISERLLTLASLPHMTQGVIITTISTLLHRLPPTDYIDSHSFAIKIGDTLNLDILKTRLIKAGYFHVSQVREHGEFAIRGAIVDLFPMGSHQPFRIDLFDNEVDTIRYFSVDTQRSLEKINEIRLLPAKEFPLSEEAIEQFRQAWRNAFTGDPLKSPIYQDISEGICSPGIEYYFPLFFSHTTTLFDYLPSQTILVHYENMAEKATEFWQEIMLRYQQGKFDINKPLLPPENLFLSLANLTDFLAHYPTLQLNGKNESSTPFQFDTESAPKLDINYKATLPLAPLQDLLQSQKTRVLFCAETLGRREVILQLLKGIQLAPPYFSSWQDFLASHDSSGMVIAGLESGFRLHDPSLYVLTESELYGKRIMQRRLRKKSVQDPDALIRNLTELKLDDPIVHIQHGIGRYRGLQVLSVGNEVSEFLCLEYQDADKIYVPVSALHLVSRYMGVEQEHAPINKLGTQHWQRAKRKAAEKIKDVAAELLALYANRAARPGLKYQFPHEQYAKFAADFPFEETPDQAQAIEQVFNDMLSPRAMDRVICGDVGFGKTEVALRAVFLAVQNNKQVAVLVPTTLLAQQHLQNFQDRFAEWPIQVEMLSRFRTSKQQKNVLERLREGKVDIVIGTHALLQDYIKFKDLGLIIVDEEHRFGVKQKEKLKKLRTNVDILTLTATPIPRTLNMALGGLRDLSIIATPPARRLSVKTFVHDYQKAMIAEAIQREIMRGGQVYFLHNDIVTIAKKAQEIAELVPETRVVVAHGQMHERELERTMVDFYHRRFNVLVCSTIIESGIDIPTANTIIINRADKFGLAQLHQLRGRVGRSHHQAYAYLLIPAKEALNADAKKRLAAITAFDELGIGFTLATQDLEIRGAGELLGEEQSGNMHEIGFSLYMDLLSRAVAALKEGKEPDLSDTFIEKEAGIDLHISALIPEKYLNDIELRLQFYKRIANAKSSTELDEIQVEMIDRFGLLPLPLKNLIAVTELKLKALALGIVKIEANEKGGKFEFNDQPNIQPDAIIKLIQTQPQQFRLEGPHRLRFVLPTHQVAERIALVENILKLLV